MSTQPAVRRWTYDEFARLPSDGNRYEVIGGKVYVTPAPTPFHQEITGRLSDLLRPFVKQHGLGRALAGPIDVLFAEGDYLEPDFIFVRQERIGLFTRRGFEGPPDLVIEIASGTMARDRGIKRQRYAQFGVPEYWLLDPRAKRLEIYRTTDDPGRQTQIVTGDYHWQPVSDGPSLEIDVAELLSDFE